MGREFRTIPLAKADEVHGSRVTRFTLPQLIEKELSEVFVNLADEGFLAGLQRRDFSRKIAALFSNKIGNSNCR